MKIVNILLILFLLITNTAYGNENSNLSETKIQMKVDSQEISINGQIIKYDGAMFFDNGDGVIYYPIRNIPQLKPSEKMEVIWNDVFHAAFICYDNGMEKEIQFLVSENKIILHDDTVIEEKMLIKNNQIFISVDLIEQIFGMDIDVVSDYDNFHTVLSEDDNPKAYHRIGYLPNDFKSVGNYIQKNIDTSFSFEKFLPKNWNLTKNNVERFSAYYMLDDFETDFGYRITSVNGQVIEIYQMGEPLYYFSGHIPTQQEVDTAINEMQKQYENDFFRQEIIKKYDSKKDLFYLERYIYENDKSLPKRQTYYFVLDKNMSYSFQKENLENIAMFIKEHINDSVDRNHIDARLKENKYEMIILSLKNNQEFWEEGRGYTNEYIVVIQKENVIGIFANIY